MSHFTKTGGTSETKREAQARQNESHKRDTDPVGSSFLLFWFWSVLCLFHCGLASIARSICLCFLFPFFDKMYIYIYMISMYYFTVCVILLALLFLGCLCLCYRCRCCFRWLSCWFRSLPCLFGLVGCMLSLLLLHWEIAKH